MVLSHSFIVLLTLDSIIKEVIDNLVIDSEKLKFVSISTIYEENNGAIIVATIPRINTTSNHINFQLSLVQAAHWKIIFDL